MPLFSIVTVCFNSANTIERTLKSVLAQGYKDYEYIIVDGGSKDRTIDILKEYEPLFEGRMYWKSEPDKGIYDAFNKGCKLAKGDFIWLVNSDDWIEPGALLRLRDIAIENNGQNCILAARMYYHFSNGLIKESPIVTKERIDGGAKNYYMGITHPASIYSKKVYEEIGLYDDRYYISGDIDHFIRCCRSGKICFISVDEFIINMSDGGVSDIFNLKKVNHDWSIRYKKFCPNKIEYIRKMLRSNYEYIKGYLLAKIRNE